MAEAFKIWRVLEEQETKGVRVITKKEFIGEIENPREAIYVTWPELVGRFGEGYYVVEIPKEIHKRYLLPEKQFVRTPTCFKPRLLVEQQSGKNELRRESKNAEEPK